MITQQIADNETILVNEENGTYVLGEVDNTRYTLIIMNEIHVLERSDYASVSEWHARALELHTEFVKELVDSGFSVTVDEI